MSQQSSVARPPGNDQGGDVDGFTITEPSPGLFHFFQRQTLNAADGHVWAVVRNFQQFVKVLIPTATFEWLDGGNPGTVPSRYRLVVGDSKLEEEIDFRDDQARVLRYHMVVTGLGIRTYSAEIKVVPISERQTAMVYTRDVTLQPGQTIETLRGLAAQQMVALTEHFALGT